MWWMLACTRDGDTDYPPLPGIYDVLVDVTPEPPVALEPAEVQYQVLRDGAPVEDLQIAHERLVHVFVLRGDLETFDHTHHEDFAAVTADDLRTATFRFPHTFSASGPFVLAFEWASENRYHTDRVDVLVAGDVPQLDAPEATPVDVVVRDDVTARLRWDTAPVVGQEAAFTVVLEDDAGPVTDLVQWLGADAHLANASLDLEIVGHTHAWVPDMDEAAPSHTMPHLYPGPEIPFRHTFPAAGTYKLWAQFARSGNVETPYTMPFIVEIPQE
jgi:hypothetical protein